MKTDNNQPDKKFPSPKASLLIALAGLLGFGVGLSWTAREQIEDGTIISSLSLPRESETGHFLAARFAEQEGDPATALTYVRKLLETQPANNTLRSDAYRLSLYLGKVDDALQDVGNLKDPDPRMPPPMLVSALKSVKEQDYESARKSLRELPSGGLNAVILPLMQLWLEAGTEHSGTKPLSSSDIEGKVNSKFTPLVDYHLALVNDQLGHTEAAEKYYLKVIKDADKLPMRATEALMNFYLRNHRIEDANKLAADPRMEPEVMEALRPMIDSKEPLAMLVKNPQDGMAELLYGIAGIFLRIGMPEDALIHLHLALYMQPSLEVAQLLRAHVWEELDHAEEALEAFRTVPKGSIYYYEAQVRANYLLSKIERQAEALKHLEVLAGEYPEKPDAELTRGDIFRHEDKYEEAIKAYSEAIKRIGEPKPYHWKVFYSRGIAYERAKQWPKAEADFNQALKLEPGQADVQNYLGYSWLTMGMNVEQARQMIEDALTAQPDNAHIIDSMGWAYYTMGDFEKSLSYLEQAVELMSNDATVNEHLGDVYWRLGRKQEARYQWEKSLAFKPEPEAEAGVRKKLAEGMPPFIPPKESLKAEGASPEHN